MKLKETVIKAHYSIMWHPPYCMWITYGQLTMLMMYFLCIHSSLQTPSTITFVTFPFPIHPSFYHPPGKFLKFLALCLSIRVTVMSLTVTPWLIVFVMQMKTKNGLSSPHRWVWWCSLMFPLSTYSKSNN